MFMHIICKGTCVSDTHYNKYMHRNEKDISSDNINNNITPKTNVSLKFEHDI